jgi:hypothetical protein
MKQKGRRQGSISAAAFCPCFLTSHGGIYGRAEYSKAVLEWEVRKACTGMHQLRFVTVVSRLKRIVGPAARKTRSVCRVVGTISAWAWVYIDPGYKTR